MGKMLALTWDCINVSEETIKESNSYLFVNKELQRVNKDVLKILEDKDVIMRFSELIDTPKTKSSVRKAFIAKTIAEMILRQKQQIEEMKLLYGNKYDDFNLVFYHSTGKPLESSMIRNLLNKLINENNLSLIIFHSFKHASITDKLK